MHMKRNEMEKYNIKKTICGAEIYNYVTGKHRSCTEIECCVRVCVLARQINSLSGIVRHSVLSTYRACGIICSTSAAKFTPLREAIFLIE